MIQTKTSLSFNRLIFWVVVLLVLIMSTRMPLESDLWWHLRAGEWSWQHVRPLLNDYFSYTQNGASWINHSWLGEVIYYLFYLRLGWGGVCLLVSILAATSIVFVYFQMEGYALFKAFLVILTCMVASFVWSPRPQMFSLVLLAGLAYVLYDFKWHQRKRLWLLPVIFAVWGNLHGGYPLGFILIGATIAGEGLNHILGYGGREILTWREIGELVGWTVVSVAALLINPNGYHILLIPFQTVGVEALQRFIQEWASPDFHDFAQQTFLIMFFVTFFLIGISGQRLDMTDATAVIIFAYMAFIARRNFGPFALVATPVISRHFQPAFKNWIGRLNGMTKIKKYLSRQLSGELVSPQSSLSTRLRLTLNISLILLLGLAFVIKLLWVSDPEMIKQANDGLAPVGAVAWVKEYQPAGNLLNEYNFGGYLIWNLRDYPVFIDGRTDLYGDELINNWFALVQADKDWEMLMTKYDIKTVMLSPNRPLVEKLINKGWLKSYEDKQVVVLTIRP
jgi:hypothetical protein